MTLRECCGGVRLFCSLRASDKATAVLLLASLVFAPLFVLIVPALLWRAVDDRRALHGNYDWAYPLPRRADAR